MNQCALFLDFDDTLSDYREQMRRYGLVLAELFCRDYGGDFPLWCTVVAGGLEESACRYEARFVNSSPYGFKKWTADELITSVTRLFERTGMPGPHPDELALIGRKYQAEALLRCSTLFDGVADTLQQLHTLGVPLVITSGNESHHLYWALKGSGILPYFTAVFGGDLFDCAKEGPEFYTCAMQVLNLTAPHVIVVDDAPAALQWAAQAGAHAIQTRYHGEDAGCKYAMDSFGQLPSLVARIAESDIESITSSAGVAFACRGPEVPH